MESACCQGSKICQQPRWADGQGQLPNDNLSFLVVYYEAQRTVENTADKMWSTFCRAGAEWAEVGRGLQTLTKIEQITVGGVVVVECHQQVRETFVSEYGYDSSNKSVEYYTNLFDRYI